jgi:hypothetical protein
MATQYPRRLTRDEYRELTRYLHGRIAGPNETLRDTETALREEYQAVCFDDWTFCDRRTYGGPVYALFGHVAIDYDEGYILTDSLLLIRGEDGRLLDLDPMEPTRDPTWPTAEPEHPETPTASVGPDAAAGSSAA